MAVSLCIQQSLGAGIPYPCESKVPNSAVAIGKIIVGADRRVRPHKMAY